MAGLRNEATLALKVTLSNSKGVTQVKKDLENLAKVFQASNFQKQMDVMQKELAETRKELRAVTAEAKKYRNDLDAANKKLAASQTQVNAALKTGISVGKQQAAAYNTAKSRAAAMTAAQAALNAAQNRGALFMLKNMGSIIRLREAMKTGSTSIKAFAASLQVAVEKDKRLEQAMRTGNVAAGKRLTVVQQLRVSFSELEHQMDALFRASLRLNITGMTLRRWGENIIRFGSDIMSTFETFEYQMVRAAGALEIWHDGVNETEVGYRELQDAIIGTADTLTYFSAEDVAESLYFWGSATGQVVEEMGDLEIALSGVSAMMKAATMTNTGYEQTIKGVYSILTQYYNGSLEEAEYVTEQLFMTTQKTAAEWMDLVNSFKMLGPVAAAAGASFEEVNQIIGTLSDLGLRGSQAGRGLRQFFIQMLRPSGPAKKAYDELFNLPQNADKYGGMSISDLVFPDGEYIGITKHIELLADATRRLTKDERLAFLARVSTANQLPIVTALVSRQIAEMNGLAEANTKLTESDASELFRLNWEGFQSTWQYVVKSLERGVEQIKLSLGLLMKDVLTPLMEHVRRLADEVVKFVETNPELVKLATQFAAVGAAILVVAGIVLTAVAAALGLGAALAVVWGATERFRNIIAGTAAALFFLLEAIVDNASYIGRGLTRAIESLNKAFGNLKGGIGSVGDLIEALTRPAREIMGIFVRLAVDIIEIAASFVEWASSIPPVATAIELLIKLVTILVSAQMVAGVFRLVAGFTALRGVIASTAMVGIFGKLITVFKALFTIVKSAVLVQGLTAIRVALTGLKVALGALIGGPLGLIALVATIGFLAYEAFPPFRDFVDGIVAGFTDTRDALDKTVERFGQGGQEMKDKIFGRLDISDEIKDAAIENEKALATYEYMISEERSENAPKYEDFLEFPEHERSGRYWAALDAFRAEQDEATAAAAEAGSNLKVVEEAAAQQVIDIFDIYEGVYNDSTMWQSLFEGVDLFSGFLSSFWDNIESGSLSEINDPWRIMQMANIVGTQAGGKQLTMGEAAEMWRGLTGIDPLFMGYTFSEFLHDTAVAGMSIVEDSVQLDDEVVAALDKAMTLQDPTEVAKILSTPFPALNDMTLADIMGTGEFQQYHAMTQQAFEWLAETEALAAEGGTPNLDVYIARIKSAAEKVGKDILLASMPNLDEITLQIQTLSLSNTQADREALAALLLEPYLPTGENFIEASEKYGIKDTAKLVEALAGEVTDPRLRELLEQELKDVAAKSGTDAGETTVTNWNKAFLDSLSGLGDISFKDIKEASKLGSVQKRIDKAFRAVYKANKKGFIDNPESRKAAREALRSVGRTRLDKSNARAAAGDTKGARKQARKYIDDTFTLDFTKLPASVQRTGIAFAKKFAKKFPNIVEQEIRNAEGLTDLQKEALMAAVFEPPPPPTIEAAIESLLGGADVVESAETAVDNITSDAQAAVEALPDAGFELGTETLAGFETGVSTGIATTATPG